MSTIQPKPSCRTSKEGAGLGYVRGTSGQDPPNKPGSSSPPSHHRSTGSLQYPSSPFFRSTGSQFSLKQLSDIHTKACQEGAQAGSDITNQKDAAENDVNKHKHPSQPEHVFYKKTGPTLSLFKRHKSLSTEEERQARISQRRGSEPGRLVMDRASTLFRARLPSDPGLKVSKVDSQGDESRFCFSPYASKSVKNYFSSHPRSHPQSSQQVALSLVESHREWLRKCINPTEEADFEQLLFAEESYV